MDSSRNPQKINSLCNHASTTQGTFPINILTQLRINHAGLLTLFAPKAHGALSQTFSEAQRTAKETLASSVRGLSFSSSHFLHVAPLPIPLPLSFSIPHHCCPPHYAAAAADLTAYTK
eukprot:1153475-Pelagomonas_calceolata.AAC.1